MNTIHNTYPQVETLPKGGMTSDVKHNECLLLSRSEQLPVPIITITLLHQQVKALYV